jgi:hypothetical protein
MKILYLSDSFTLAHQIQILAQHKKLPMLGNVHDLLFPPAKRVKNRAS